MPALDQKYQDTLETIKLYPQQFKQAWEEMKLVEIPQDYTNIENVVFCGMGGSALGARVADSVLFDTARIPIEIFTGYKLPNYAKKNSLVIVSSYSGSTEETIANTQEGINEKVKLFGISTGGKLAELLKTHNLPAYIFEPRHNPSKQPRMAIGYATGAVLGLFSRLQISTISDLEIEEAINIMETTFSENCEDVDENLNLAKKYANNLRNKTPLLVSSEHLLGAVHTVKNQFNESSKTFSTLFDLPELNHHLMEGLKYPAKIHELFVGLLFYSELYSDRVKKRYPITMEVFEKNGLGCLMYISRSKTKLSQALEVVCFGSLVVYYLAKNYQVDPSTIPWVDYFKEQLAKI